MSEEKTVNVSAEKLHGLIKNKLHQAGLPENQAQEVANHLTYANLSGIDSHGAVRVEYYAERIAKGGVNTNPQLRFEETGPTSGIFHGDNGQGHYVVNEALDTIIKMAKENGAAQVGISKVSHTGTLAYYLRKIASEDLVVISMTNSDPMVVPFGGSEVYYGTNPIAFGAPRANGEPVVFDMATTVQAWGKVLDARSKGKDIPADWAVDANGEPTTDPHAVNALLPIAGPKGYGLMMLVDILAAVLLGLPSGKHVSSMYDKLDEGRNLGQFFIVIDPDRFVGAEAFKEAIEQNVQELHAIEPAPGFDQVYYPGELTLITEADRLENGLEIPEPIMAYLESDVIHNDNYGGKGSFA